MGKAEAAVLDRPDEVAGPTDHELVRRVRNGDDRAFEALYSRYQRRIAGYAYGMVKDYGRAEDITQEVFVSALRRMRQTERPIAFKPWIYEIAKNACIDAYRRGRRAEEVSFDADERLLPSDYGRLVATGPSPDAALDAKQDLDHLCGAFGGLSDSHHQILVMRELEGLSYKAIGERMGMSRAAVESTLFRARKRLGEEYDELASGARCLRIQAIIADAGGSRVGLRDQRRLARHISHCQPCRRVAVHAGLDVPVPARTRIAEKLAGLLPLPAFLRLRRGGEEAAAATGGGGGNRWAAHMPMLADTFQSGWSKAAAGVAALAMAGAGAGVATTLVDERDARGTSHRPVAERTTTVDPAGDRATAPRPAAPAAAGEQRRAVRSERRTVGTAERPRGRERGASESAGGDSRPAAPRPAPAGAPPADPDRPAGGGGGEDRAGGGDQARKPAAKAPADDVPDVKVPDVPAAGGAGQKLQETADNVNTTVEGAADGVGTTVDNALGNVQKTLDEPQNLVPNVTDTVDQAVKDVGGTAGGAVGNLGKTVGDLLKPRGSG
jgi:RNA polymerase sigma factor (sigma-70 family)